LKNRTLKKLLLIILITISIKLYSQESKYSLKLSLPIQSGESFINENYSGITDIGFRARFRKTNHINLSFHLNGSFFKYKGTV